MKLKLILVGMFVIIVLFLGVVVLIWEWVSVLDVRDVSKVKRVRCFMVVFFS